MAVLSVQKPAAAGTALSLVAATSGATGDQWVPTGKEMLVVLNGGGAPINVTFTCYRPCDTAGLLHDSVQAVAAGAREYFPPVGPAFIDPVTGMAKVTYSAVTSVTVGVVASS